MYKDTMTSNDADLCQKIMSQNKQIPSIFNWSSLPDMAMNSQFHEVSHRTLKITIDWHTPNWHFLTWFIYKEMKNGNIVTENKHCPKRFWHNRIDFISAISSDVTTNKIETLISIVLHDACILGEMNSIVPVRCVCNLQSVNFKLIPRIIILWIQCDISLGSVL